jgi:ribonuclease J
MTSEQTVHWIALGGLGEIGLNCMVFECQEQLLVLDAGSMFPERHMLGVDLVIPDIHYLQERADRIMGILVTHGHEDHIGALPYVLSRLPSVPLYGMPMTLGLIREKLTEHHFESLPELREVHPREILTLGPFHLEFIRVGHSITDGFGLAIDTPAGVVIHSGDFKFDPSPVGEAPMDIHSFSRYGDQGVRLLLSDSTNIEQCGYSVSETQIQRNLEAIFRTCPGRIIFSTFSSNIQRIREVAQLADQFGRKLYINGRSMITAVRLASELDYLQIPQDRMVESSDLPHIPKEQLVALTTGSQGEPLSALSLMASGKHKWLSVESGDTVILSCRIIPGNEKAIYEIINNLYRRGARVIYHPLAEVHVSGHASREELKLMIHLTRPEHFIPIHGEYRHLVQHRELAVELGVSPDRAMVAENGDIFTITPNGITRQERVETGRVYVDGKGVGDVGNAVLRDRQHLSEDGMVVILIVLDEVTGEIISGPEMFSRGFVFEEKETQRMEEAREIVLEALSSVRHASNGEFPEDLQAELRRTLKSHFWRSIRRRPMIMPIIVEL